jgi:hypothetical protein
MRKDRTTLLSYLSAGGISAVTLFVFWAFQNFGPDSAVRRLHVVVERINRYIPPEMPVQPRLLKPLDAYELSALCVNGVSDPATEWMIDELVRPRLYARSKYSIYRTQYESFNKATTVMLYEIPGGKGADVYVLRKQRDGPWQIDANETAKLWSDLRRPLRRF